jgi:hypothetical protein
VTVYFTATHSIKRFTAVFGLFLLGLGTAVTGLTASSPQELRFILNYFFALVFIVAGSFVLKFASATETTRLSISSEGVSCGTQWYSWSEIAQLGVMPGRKEFYCTPRSAPFAYEFSISCRPTSKEINDLFDVLGREVLPLHPHVRLCNDDQKPKR